MLSMGEQIGIVTNMTTSSRFVLMILQEKKIATVNEIQNRSKLSRRTIMNSIRDLRKLGLIDVHVCLSDTRKRFYCLRIV
jgi:DNA-binding MarR family transcriptional regulator